MAADARFDDHAARHQLPHPLAVLYDRLRAHDDAARLSAALAFAEGVARYLAWTLLADVAARNLPRRELAKHAAARGFGAWLHVIRHLVEGSTPADGRLYPELDGLLQSPWWASLDRLRVLRNEAAHGRVNLHAAASSLLAQHRADLDAIVHGCTFLIAYPLGSLGRVRIDTTGRPHGVWRSCRGTTPRGVMVDLPDVTGIPSDQLLLVDTARGVTLTLAPFLCLLHDEFCWLDLPARGDTPRSPYLSPVPGRPLADGVPAGLYDPSGTRPDGLTLDAWLDDPTLRPRYTPLPTQGGALALIIGTSQATMVSFPSRAPPPVEASPRPSAASSHTSLPPMLSAPKPTRRLARRTLAALIGAMLVLTAVFGTAGTYALRRNEPTRPVTTETAVTSPLSSWPTLEARLRAWSDAIRSPTISDASMGRFYANRVRFRSGGLVEGGFRPISNYWLAWFGRNGGTLEVDWSRSRWRHEPLANTRGLDACAQLEGATGDVVLARLAMTEIDPTRLARVGRELPCERLSGVYLVRMREVAGRGLRICQESWNLREGICAPGSCPQAPACRGARR